MLRPRNVQMPRQTLSVLGSTGSIGVQTLEIVRQRPEDYDVYALSAHRNVALLAAQTASVQPKVVVLTDLAAYKEAVKDPAFSSVRVLFGPDGLDEIAAAPEADTIVAAIVGVAGMQSVAAAARAGKRIALANKETLVVGGRWIMDLVSTHGATLLPVDSEHSAIFQVLKGEPAHRVAKLILTASGGPFRTREASFDDIRPEDALRHPNWEMGAKITIDSATLMNKGLEVIEARWLFDVHPDQIEVVVHPPSVIHSMVEFVDGSTKAQLGPPSMLVPIQYALTWPDRMPANHPRVDWTKPTQWSFSPPDLTRFPCLSLAFQALRQSDEAPGVLNAANEVAVAAFLRGEIRFTDIPRWVERALTKFSAVKAGSLSDMLEVDQSVRTYLSEPAT